MGIRNRKVFVFLFGLGLVLVLVGAWLAISSGSDSADSDNTTRLYFYNWEKNLTGPAREFQASRGSADAQSYLERQRQKWIDAGRPPAVGFNRQLITQGAEPTRQDAVDLASKQPGDTIIVAEPPTGLDGELVGDPEAVGYFVLKNDPAFSSDEIRKPRMDTGLETNEPIVTFGFTAQGRKAFGELTRQIAQEGAARSEARGAWPPDPNSASQFAGSFVVVLGGRVIAKQLVDFALYPDGIDGRMGFLIAGGLDLTEARQLVSLLQ